ncbi:MAG: hypothetical protein ABI703_05705 [Gemmatimonadales bacterium]
MARIRRFGVAQTAKVVGVLYTLVGVVALPFILIAAMYSPNKNALGTGFAFALPIIYGVVGFIFTAIGCAIYNFVAGLVGGIEVELDASPT